MKLNLGCGQNKIAGFINVDKFAVVAPDAQVDLEVFPWPWAENSVDTVMLNHVLEHLGRVPDVFIGIMKELHRVCKPGAQVHINVPHPRHDHFIGDPTHVRIITPGVLSLFSKKNCENWAKVGAANSPLAVYANVDFEMLQCTYTLAGRWATMRDQGLISPANLEQALNDHNNVCSEIRMVLQVVKD